jgi:hypothetical protein
MTPIRFTYFDEDAGQKVYVSILGQFTHHFTRENMYHVRAEYSDGFVMEPIYDEAHIRELLKKRVEE